MKFKWFRWDETVAVYVSLAVSVVSLLICGGILLTIKDSIRAEVRDSVVVTKVRIAELEAATRIGLARKEFDMHGSFVTLRDEISSSASELSAVYLDAPAEEQDRWIALKTKLDLILDSLKARDRDALVSIDEVVVALRSDIGSELGE